MSDIGPKLEQVKGIAEEAGALLLEHFYSLSGVRAKSSSHSYDLVSDADEEAESLIISRIRELFPEHSVLAEESQRDTKAQGDLWIVDPLDGTNNFVHGVPHFAVSIAFHQVNGRRLGVVFNPVTAELFSAESQRGAWRNEQAVSVSQVEKLSDALIGTGFYYDRGEMMERTLDSIRELFGRSIHGIRRNGTASLDLCYVAAGRFDAFFEYFLSPWDYAAGKLIVEEAGGKVTKASGDALSLEATGLLASNSLVHQEVLAIVGKNS